jgi:hypothetical protein
MKTILFSGFKNPKKIRKTRKFESIHEKHFLKQKKRAEKQTKTQVCEDSSLCPET